MKIKKLMLIFAIIMLIGIGITSFFYGFYIIKDVRVIPIYLEIEQKVGFNLEEGELNFGKVPFGGMAKREISLTNNYNHPITADLRISGNVKEFIFVDDDYFILQPDETRFISVSARIPPNATEKKYEGKATITIRRYQGK